MPSAPSVSVIIETDNLRGESDARARALLAALELESRTFPGTVEVVVAHDPDEISTAALEALLAGVALEARVLACRRNRYYALKNAGAHATTGDLLVFVDGDVIPEPHFLARLVAAFDDPAVEVAGGSTYVGPLESAYARAFALFWLFPARVADGPPAMTSGFYPNCLAMRRTLFERHPFPVTDTYRRGGEHLAGALRQAGVAIWTVPAARVCHPAPRFPRAYVTRALQEGYDRFQDRASGRRRGAGPASTPARVDPFIVARGLRTSLGGAGDKIRRGKDRVGMRAHEVPFALGLALGYELLVRVGFVATIVHRRAIPRLTGEP